MSDKLLAIVPTESSDFDNVNTPSLLYRSVLGRKPKTPFKAAGTRIDPEVSVPIPICASPRPTATAEPAEDPPGNKGSFSVSAELGVPK